MSSFIGIVFGFLFGNMFGFEDISTQLFNQDTKLLNILEKTRRMCKKIPPSLTGFDVVGLSYHGSRIANLPVRLPQCDSPTAHSHSTNAKVSGE